MTSRERVLAVLAGTRPDRVPLNFFAGWNIAVREKVCARYGSIEAFCERMHTDIVTGVLPRFPFGGPENHERIADLDKYLELEPDNPKSPAILSTPCDEVLNNTVAEALRHHQQDKAVFCHAWGVFELSQFLFEKHGRPGVEQALINMAAEPEKTKRMFMKLACWTADCVENAIKAGVDVIELSDDWGQQRTMLFSPEMWWEMVYPATKIIVDRARQYQVPVLLHSDGDITQVLDGVIQLGINALHPVQESSGMSPQETREKLGPKICIMGGLDTITALPVMTPEQIRLEVERVFGILKNSGGYIFSGSHMIQDDTELEVVEAAYERAYELANYF
ncbi:MAG: uroporphyrinogen decarboxylase family protein [candidate division KSB1 bacterium]|nr:uroporphyrinogen decarboxylase family protein [candidate division KSB1 bacterium]MDZ7303262.1 uroporphyrinogen decarboxylase family protein [candidate division KSB1 bacterium]